MASYGDIYFFNKGGDSKFKLDGEAAVHAVALKWKGCGILILGSSGSGKSDLALRLIDKGAVLIADDYVLLKKDGQKNLMAIASERNAGKIEVRGVGLISTEYLKKVKVDFVLNLKLVLNEIERMPKNNYFYFDDLKVPLFDFYSFEISACEKIKIIIEELHSLFKE